MTVEALHWTCTVIVVASAVVGAITAWATIVGSDERPEEQKRTARRAGG